MANWVIQVSSLLKRFEYYLLRDNYLQCDETRLQVLDEPDRHAGQLSKMWVRRTLGDTPIILFNYSTSRSGEEAARYLKDFQGIFKRMTTLATIVL